MSSPPPSRRAVALLVGIGNYRQADRIASLRYASRDARSLARLLIDPDVCAFPRDSVVLLTEQKAKRTTIVRHLSSWLPEQAKGAELAFIYFAGHGVAQRVGLRDEGYLLPHDADADNVISNGISMSDVARWIGAIDAATSVVVCLDCCHAGNLPLTEGVSLRGDRDMQIPPSLIKEALSGGRGRFLIASCGPGQKSIEAAELKHGLFTYHLLKGLKGAGDANRDGQVSVTELFNYVSAAVSRDARERHQREQVPLTTLAYLGGDVVLSSPRRSAALPAPSTVGVDAADSQQVGEDAEVLDRLRGLRRRPDPAAVPTIFRGLAHKNAPVRQQAQRALTALGWEQVTKAVEALARGGEKEPLVAVLDGLAALEAHADVVGLLDRLAGLLSGELLDNALWLLDRKRLALEREHLAAVFREKQIRYEILKVLGPGLYTGAYLARKIGPGQLEVVVRVLRPEFAGQPLIRTHFVELGKRALRLWHHNLVRTLEVDEFPECELCYTLRDYVPGATLREVLAAGRRFEPLQACKVLRQILEALTPLHNDGMAHAGVKPSNVFLTRDDRILLGDPSLPIPAGGFDLPRLAYDYRYVAPELFRPGGRPVPASDFYALGCVAHELFCGQPPFVSDSHFELITRHARDPVPPVGPPPLNDWLGRALAKQPADRFAGLDDALSGLLTVENAFRPRPEVMAADLSPPAADLSPRLEHGPVGPPTSVHLLREQSLMAFEDRQSLVPMEGTFAPTNGPMTVPPGYDSFAPPSISLPGYEILGILGRGGMGVVYKARQVSLNRIVALKMTGRGYLGDEVAARFRREAEAVARLQHPGIVQVYELGEANGNPFFAMEFCGGGSLALRLRDQGPLAPRAAAGLVEQVARAVHAAHERGVVHRDLKPANVLFTDDETPKVTDFGLAKRLDEEQSHTQSGAVLGTPSYMAPEQARSEKDIGPRTDVYALGATLYECLTGQLPFHGPSPIETMMQVMNAAPVPPSRLCGDLPAELDAITLRCLEKDPARRYASAAELADDLQRFLNHERVTAAPRRARGWRGWWPFGGS